MPLRFRAVTVGHVAPPRRHRIQEHNALPCILSQHKSRAAPYSRPGSGQVTGPAASGVGTGSGSRALIRVKFLRDEPRHNTVAQERRPVCVETLVSFQRYTDLPIAVHEDIVALTEQRHVCVSHAGGADKC